MPEITLQPLAWVPNTHLTTEDDGWGGNFSEIPPVLVARMRLRAAF